MSNFWNKILLNKIFHENKKRLIKYKLITDIGRFYFYFEREHDNDNEIKARLVFFPNIYPKC